MATLTAPRIGFERFAQAFERNTAFGHMHVYDTYRAWLEAMWAFLDAVRNPDGFKQCLDRYSREEGEEFGRLMGLYVDAVEAEPFRDVLGEIFMRLDVKSARAGQYFTPHCVAEAMARMSFERAQFERLVQEKGEVTVCDPCVGSGVMLLAYARIVNQEFGYWGTSRLRLYGTDIDQRCVHMCRIQLRMNGLDEFDRMVGMLGVIAQGIPAGAVVLKPGRQTDLPGFAA